MSQKKEKNNKDNTTISNGSMPQTYPVSQSFREKAKGVMPSPKPEKEKKDKNKKNTNRGFAKASPSFKDVEPKPGTSLDEDKAIASNISESIDNNPLLESPSDDEELCIKEDEDLED